MNDNDMIRWLVENQTFLLNLNNKIEELEIKEVGTLTTSEKQALDFLVANKTNIGKLSKLIADVSNNDYKITDVNRNLSTINSNIASIKTSNSGLDRRIKSLEKTVSPSTQYDILTFHVSGGKEVIFSTNKNFDTKKQVIEQSVLVAYQSRGKWVNNLHNTFKRSGSIYYTRDGNITFNMSPNNGKTYASSAVDTIKIKIPKTLAKGLL